MPSLDLGPVVGPQGEQGATGAQGIRGEQGLPGPNQVTNSTATPLTGVLTGNGSVVGVASIDAAPTADSTGFARSGGTDKAIKGRVPVYGMGKNLLDNWYFRNPVNQRGQSSYSTDGAYTIDRWKLGGAAGTASFDSTGALMSNQTLIGNWFETSRVISGATYTISALWSNGLITATGTLTIGAGTSTWQISYGEVSGPRTIAIRQLGTSVFQFILVGDGTNKAIAAKVELGTEQTLCHNEGTAEAPVWVLNEIPDYGEELRKCQRYLCALNANGAVYGTVAIGMAYTSTSVELLAFLPVTMRPGTATLSFTGAWQITDTAQGGQKISVANIALNSTAFYSGNTVVLSSEVSDATPGKVYNLRANNNASARIFISAEL